ncbi:hypothetical protein OHB12_02845 [Nocardia sp. NBC_01730]|uniref:hypothetical protein n=1 Tax=Nocardia sp. NBC_01730 TaxID=2975998 RepID=UPI002E0FB525|nr:hypothetical protein OHB12_02845 [Nocardia sp. NBC_01730]
MAAQPFAHTCSVLTTPTTMRISSATRARVHSGPPINSSSGVFGMRGGDGLTFTAVRHERLRKLAVQSDGLLADAVRGFAASDLPALTHLDLWLGTSDYGGDSSVADLASILAGDHLPSVKYLALRNSEIQDEIAPRALRRPWWTGWTSPWAC